MLFNLTNKILIIISIILFTNISFCEQNNLNIYEYNDSIFIETKIGETITLKDFDNKEIISIVATEELTEFPKFPHIKEIVINSIHYPLTVEKGKLISPNFVDIKNNSDFLILNTFNQEVKLNIFDSENVKLEEIIIKDLFYLDKSKYKNKIRLEFTKNVNKGVVYFNYDLDLNLQNFYKKVEEEKNKTEFIINYEFNTEIYKNIKEIQYYVSDYDNKIFYNGITNKNTIKLLDKNKSINYIEFKIIDNRDNLISIKDKVYSDNNKSLFVLNYPEKIELQKNNEKFFIQSYYDDISFNVFVNNKLIGKNINLTEINKSNIPLNWGNNILKIEGFIGDKKEIQKRNIKTIQPLENLINNEEYKYKEKYLLFEEDYSKSLYPFNEVIINGRNISKGKLFLNGLQLKQDESGTFNISVKLKEGQNVLIFEIKDNKNSIIYNKKLILNHNKLLGFNPGEIKTETIKNRKDIKPENVYQIYDNDITNEKTDNSIKGIKYFYISLFSLIIFGYYVIYKTYLILVKFKKK